MISERALPYIKASVPVLQAHGLNITTVFYNNLFQAHPALRNTFNMRHQADGMQQQSLAAAVFAYAAHIEHPEALAPVISRIVHKHAALGVTAEAYPIVGTHLLGAIKQVLGDAATQPLIDAWAEAYGSLADALIAEEKRLYGMTAPAGQLSRMRVIELQPQSPSVTRFRLQPMAGEALPHYQPGQYISVFVTFADGQCQSRQYSLASAPDSDYLTISVKKSPAATALSVSNWLHEHVRVGDTLEVSHPYGDFVIAADENQPLVLVAAGVGITPMMSALNQLMHQRPQQVVHLLYAIHTQDDWLHQDEIQAAVKQMPHLNVKLYISQGPGATGQRLSVQDVPPAVLAQAAIYLCGPTGFMQAQKEALLAQGVSPSQIHREVFGPDLLEEVVANTRIAHAD